jgi:microcystin-dependent protein
MAYNALFNVIGNTYGDSKDKTKFKLPDLKDKFIMGNGSNNAVGTYKAAGLPNISGSFSGVGQEYSNDSNDKATLNRSVFY